jgi:acetyl esterase/lipase
VTGIAVAIVVALALVAGLAVTHRFFAGPDLSAFDSPVGERFGLDQPPSRELAAVIGSLGGLRELLRNTPRRQHLAATRKFMDEAFPDDDLGATFLPQEADGVRGEWVLADGADPARRTLYVHGGAFTMGSPRSHRRLTSAFSRITNGAVFAVDYRLMPEHRRVDGIEDCQAAYRWLLDNGPNGRAPAAQVVVAGDSSGANLALALVAWVRDRGLRAPDAAVALSPLTDFTLCAPSLRENVRTDPMLGPLIAPLVRAPHALLLWYVAWMNRMRPCDPRISPVHGDLSRLPPVLVQASEAEMLRDDARRYANRARAAGSPVHLQTWAHMVHVWQIFHPDLPEGRAALEHVRAFLAARTPPPSGPIAEALERRAPAG